MKPQTPAEGIMITHEFNDSIFYEVRCTSCGQDEHNIEVEVCVEVEDDCNTVDMRTYIKATTPYWKNLVKSSNSKIDSSFLWTLDYRIRGLINGFYHRVCVTWELWTQGYVRYYHTISMSDQQAINFSDVIKTAVKDHQNKAKKLAKKK